MSEQIDDAEGALREAMTDVLAIAEVPDEDAPPALLASLRDLGWALTRVDAPVVTGAAEPKVVDLHGSTIVGTLHVAPGVTQVRDGIFAGPVAAGATVTEWAARDRYGQVHSAHDEDAARSLVALLRRANSPGELVTRQVPPWTVVDERILP